MATRLLLVLCVCGLLSAEDAGAPEPLALGWLNACPPGWTLFGSRCFIFHRAPKSFPDAEEGRWMWSDGSAFDYSVWHKGEPSNYRGTEHCTEMYYRGRFWNDEVCSDKNPYICSRRL
ncbi:galactose-specific lectin nattectin-like [Menidia menidia]